MGEYLKSRYPRTFQYVGKNGSALCGESGKKLVRNEDFTRNDTQPAINATA